MVINKSNVRLNVSRSASGLRTLTHTFRAILQHICLIVAGSLAMICLALVGMRGQRGPLRPPGVACIYIPGHRHTLLAQISPSHIQKQRCHLGPYDPVMLRCTNSTAPRHAGMPVTITHRQECKQRKGVCWEDSRSSVHI